MSMVVPTFERTENTASQPRQEIFLVSEKGAYI